MGEFAERLCAAGIAAELVCGATPSAVRKALAACFESGDTRVDVCVRCWNEGIDVPCLATVVFCDARDSDFNKRQLAQRASRRYFAKPYYRVVLVIREELDDVEGLLSSFLDDDPCFRASARSGLGGGRTDSRVTLEHATDDAELISETLLTRLGTQDKVDLLVRFVTEQGRAPKQDERPDGVNIEQFLDRIRGNWRGGKVKTTLSREQMDAIEACPPWRSASPREFCPGRRKSPASSSSRRNIR